MSAGGDERKLQSTQNASVGSGKNEWLRTSCQGGTKQGEQQNKRSFVLSGDKELNYSAFLLIKIPLKKPPLNVMFIQHMVYADNASAQIP